MGGNGSGRHGEYRQTIEDLSSLDIRGVKPIHELDYYLKKYKFALTYTRCNYGGKRYWFVCPVCERRVAILYRGNGAYACRKCQGLPYISQWRDKTARLRAKIADIRFKLEWEKDTFWGPKPKGMRHTTFHRLVTELHELAQAYDKCLAVELDSMLKRTKAIE